MIGEEKTFTLPSLLIQLHYCHPLMSQINAVVMSVVYKDAH